MDGIVWAVIDVEKGIVAICSTVTTAFDMADKFVSANYPVDTIEECENVEVRSIELNTWIY